MAIRHNSSAVTIVRITLAEIVCNKIIKQHGADFKAEVISELRQIINAEIENIRSQKNPAHLGVLEEFPGALEDVIEEIS